MAFERKLIKNNFLKQRIIRIDFSGAVESEMEDTIIKVKKYLMNHDFNRSEEKNNLNYNINIQALESMETPTIQQTSSQKIFILYNEDKGISAEISKNFICVNVTSTKYIPFEEYCEFFIEICKIVKREIPLLSFLRLGIRKINTCAVTSLDKINLYFKEKYFNYDDFFENAETLNTVKRYIFRKNNNKINFISNIVKGKNGTQEVFTINLDTDISLDDEKQIKLVIEDSAKLAELNNDIFTIYSKSITDFLYEKLCQEDFNDDNIMGIERNA